MIYTNNQFTGHYPVGSAAVVRAANAEEAAKLLEEVLAEQGLKQKVPPEQMKVFVGKVTILCDGEY